MDNRCICVDRYLNVLAQYSVNYAKIGFMVKDGKFYLRVGKWIYQMRLYDLNMNEVTGVSFINKDVSYIAFNNIVIDCGWSKYIYIIVSEVFKNDVDTGFKLIVSSSSDIDAIGSYIDTISFYQYSKTGCANLISLSLDKYRTVGSVVIQGEIIDTKYLVFDSDDIVLRV